MDLKKSNLSVASALTALAMSLSINAHANDIKDNLDYGGEIELFTKPLLSSQSAFSLNGEMKNTKTRAMAAQNAASAITPVCPTLSTGVLYNLTNVEKGTNPCYHFEITQRSKTTAILTNQAAGTNIDLNIIRHNPDNTFTVIGSSKNAGNADEGVKVLTEPGHYYWFMDAVEATNASVSFGASVATRLDAYEFNDTVATSTILSDKQHHITGNMDSSNDVDYFQFTAVRGQDVILKLEDKALDEWILEVYSNGWVPLSIGGDSLTTLNNLQPNQKINARVRPNPNATVNPINKYKLTIGSKVAAIKNISGNHVNGEYNVERVPYSAFGSLPYGTTQAYQTLTWHATLLDSRGAAVEGALAELQIDKYIHDGLSYTVYSDHTNKQGTASGTISLGRCSGAGTTYHNSPPLRPDQMWKTELNMGVWRMVIPNTGGTVGIGGSNVEYVWLAHLCDQDIINIR